MRNSTLIVLGMHRSGTSAMGGVLGAFGVDFGDHLYKPQIGVNEKGFFEHGPIVDSHDELLLQLGSSWDDPRPLHPGWQERESIADIRQRLTRRVVSDFADSALWGLKDPRICRLLPLWHEILEGLDVSARYLIMVRSPLEVAASLNKRNGFGSEKSLFLWWQHVAEAERQTRDSRRVFVSYDDLLEDPKSCIARIASALEISWPKPPEVALAEVERFLTPGLRHHRDAGFQGASRLEKEVEHAYQAYLGACRDAERASPRALAPHQEAFDAFYASLSPVLKEHLDAVSDLSRAAHLSLQRNYGCYAVKIAKRLCLAEHRIARLFGRGS